MVEQSILLKLSYFGVADDKTSQLRQEYQVVQRLFQKQSPLVQQYLITQAASIAEAVVKGSSWVPFNLPDAVSFALIPDDYVEDEVVPVISRHQVVRADLFHFTHKTLRSALCQRLAELERSSIRAVLISAGLLRYAIAVHMVYNLLPAGRTVIYKNVDGDDIPNQPDGRDFEAGAGKISAVDRYDETGNKEHRDGELSVPYVEAARHFYLPQWVAFDEHGAFLLNTVREAEAHVASMHNYLDILDSAVLIAPYMIADEICQQKRYGMLGQLVNQGRALASYQTQEMIRAIQHRAAEHKLDRGLRLSLPYFDDQKMTMDEYNFDVIPVGRIMFIPAFIVLAVREQGIKIAQDTRFSQSTRKHLLTELSRLEQAFLR